MCGPTSVDVLCDCLPIYTFYIYVLFATGADKNNRKNRQGQKKNRKSLQFIRERIIAGTSSGVENADASVSAVVYLVVTQHRITLGFDPNAGHCIVKYLVVFNHAEAAVIHQDPAVLSAPDLVTANQRVAASPATSARFLSSQTDIGLCRSMDARHFTVMNILTSPRL